MGMKNTTNIIRKEDWLLSDLQFFRLKNIKKEQKECAQFPQKITPIRG